MKWKEGQVPLYIWLDRKQIGAKSHSDKGPGTRLLLGNVKCWTMNLALNPKEWVCYRLVPNKKVVRNVKRSKG